MSEQRQSGDWFGPLMILLVVTLAAILLAALVLSVLMSTALPPQASSMWPGSFAALGPAGSAAPHVALVSAMLLQGTAAG